MKFFSLTCLGILIAGLVSPAFSQTSDETYFGYNQYKTGKYSYTSNVANICLGQDYGGDYWNFNTNKQLIIEHRTDKYPDLSLGAGASFEEIRKIYEDTQNNIMNCSILKTKYTLHKKLINEYKLSEKVQKFLEKANEVIIKQIEDQKCIAARDEDKIYNYKDLLDSLTYEQCGYTMYLYYYKNYCDTDIGKCTGLKYANAGTIIDHLASHKNALDQELELSNRSLDTALSLYENFEKTYIAHVLLQLIEVELVENKRFTGIAVKALQQWVSLTKNAQKSPQAR